MNFPLEIIVKTGKSKTEILKEVRVLHPSRTRETNIVYLNVKGMPIDNEANVEIIKFFSKLTGKRVKIVFGLKSKKKVVDLC